MGQIITIANQKGGVGKTTTALNLSSCLAVAEKRTLLIDIDPQANATSGLGIDPRQLDRSTYDVLVNHEQIERVIQSTRVPNLDIVPAHINLVGAEVELIQVIAREKILREALKPVKDTYDYIFVDCPPLAGYFNLKCPYCC